MEFQFCKMRRVLEMDWGDSCTAISIQIKFLSVTEPEFRFDKLTVERVDAYLSIYKCT